MAERLRAALARPSHAYLFAGPARVGKRTAARAFAQGLLCERRAPGGDACGGCDTCRTVGAEGHPDVRFWELADDEKTFKVERVRELITAVGRKPFSAPRQVHVLCAFDALQAAGANALLKTLEEPPPTTTLIGLTRDVDGVLPTLVSRCQVIRFGLTEADAMAETLARWRGVPPEAARRIARASEGRMGQALALAQTGAPARPERPAWPGRDDVMAFSDALAGQPAEAQQAALDGLLLWVSDLARLSAAPTTPAETLHHPEHHPALASHAARAGATACLALAEAIEAAREALGRHVHARLVLDRLGRQLADMGP